MNLPFKKLAFAILFHGIHDYLDALWDFICVKTKKTDLKHGSQTNFAWGPLEVRGLLFLRSILV